MTCHDLTFDQLLVRFYVVFSPQTWPDSDLDCRSRGGFLATFDDLTMHQLIETHLSSSQCNNKNAFWIGANDVDIESHFVWSNGDNVSFSRWFPGWPLYNNYSQQPSDDGLSKEDCVEMRRRFYLPWIDMQDAGGYFWNDRDCGERNPFICKVDLQDTLSIPSNNSSSCNVMMSLAYSKPNRTVRSADDLFLYCTRSCLTCLVTITAPEAAAGVHVQVDATFVGDAAGSHVCDENLLVLKAAVIEARRTLCIDWSNNSRLVQELIATNATDISFTIERFHTMSVSSIQAAMLNSLVPLQTSHRAIVVGENLSVDIYSSHFPGNLGVDFTDMIIFSVSIGNMIEITNVEVYPRHEARFVGSITFEDLSLGTGSAHMLGCFCFFSEKVMDENLTAVNHMSESCKKTDPHLHTHALGVDDEDDKNDGVDAARNCSLRDGTGRLLDMTVSSRLNSLRMTIHSTAGSTGFRVHLSAHAVDGPMCTPRLEGGSRENLGQRLLKEPIWIGLIVILSVIMLFGVVYIMRRKCGTLFVCCEVPRTKDDNILNANGTITLNSFPLKTLTRPSISVISLSSPVLTRGVHQKNGTRSSIPGVHIWNAAATFFASYRDTERSLVASPLTTDFSRTTDTSLSQVAGDASVGAVVGGRLQLDLHIRENREREAISMTSPVLHMAAASMLTITPSLDGDSFVKCQDSTCNQLSSGPSHRFPERGQTISRALGHIYPCVIVRPPHPEQWAADCISYEIERGNVEKNEPECIDSTGTHVIQVNLEDDSDDMEGLETSKSDTETFYGLPVRNIHCHSADIIHQPECTDNESVHINIPECWSSIERADSKGDGHKVLRQSVKAKTVVENKLVTPSAVHKPDMHGPVARSRSKPSFLNRDSRDDNRGHACQADPDCSRSSSKRLGQTMRFSSSCQQLAYNEIHPPYGSCSRVGHWNSPACDRLVCSVNRCDSLASTASSASKPAVACRDIVSNRTRQKEYRLKHMKFHRSASTNSEQSTGTTQRKPRKSCSRNHRHSHSRMKHTPSARSPGCTKGKYHSSTINDFSNMKRQSYQCNRQENIRQEDSRLVVSVPAGVSPTTLAAVEDQVTPTPDTDVKDFFQKVFSQEIDLDDLSLPDEDDIDFLIRIKSDSKQRCLSSEPPGLHSLDNDERHTTSEVMGPLSGANSVKVDDDDDPSASLRLSGVNSVKVDDDPPASLRLNIHKNSVVTMLGGPHDRISVSKSASIELHQAKEGLTANGSCATPTTCNVIVYDSNRDLDKPRAAVTVQSTSGLTRKHSSLDLVEPQKKLLTNHQSLRTTSSMQELSKQSTPGHQEDMSVNKVPPFDSRSTSSFLQDYQDLSKGTMHVSRVISDHNDTDDNESFSFQTLKEHVTWPYSSSDSLGGRQYLSVTDFDTAMSWAASPQVKHDACTHLPSVHPANGPETTLKDSAYQSKQSSVEKENTIDTRVWRPMAPLREEDRRVTQRLQQAALKLLAIQQRCRKANDNLSNDSAVHTISEDDATLDDVTVTSAHSRTYKSDGVHFVQIQQGVHDFSLVYRSKSLDEQEMVFEYDV